MKYILRLLNCKVLIFYSAQRMLSSEKNKQTKHHTPHRMFGLGLCSLATSVDVKGNILVTELI